MFKNTVEPPISARPKYQSKWSLTGGGCLHMYESLDHILGQNFASITCGNFGDLPHANAVSFFFFHVKSQCQEKSCSSH